MIRVRYEKNKLSVLGHADALCGFDPVCAAVSTLIQSLVSVLIKRDGELWKSFAVLEKGVGEISAYPLEGHESETEILFEMTVEGIRLLAEDFPQNVELVSRGDSQDDSCEV